MSVPLVVHEATRSLLWLSSPRDARRTAIDLVHALGGEVVAAGSADPGVVPVDISFGDGDPLLPMAPPHGEARSLLDRYLAPFVLDARRVLDLAGQAERLAESASIDALTGLLNRRMLDRALGRLGRGETVVIVDLDHFKAVNDGLGHVAGDEVLRGFGAALRNVLRGRDLVGRYGGEEFVIVVSPPSNADALLERLHTEWTLTRPMAVTFSAGIAAFAGDANATVQLADEALYRAKEAGRDRWMWADGPPETPEHADRSVEPYLDQAVAGHRPPAVRIALDLLDHRVPQGQILEELLAAAQREVGERWHRNELSPAEEHLASGVTGAALDALAAETSEPTRDGHVVVACAEGDWHSLAAQMFGEGLRLLGFGVTVLGASTPAGAVADYLSRSGSHVLAVSCNLPIFFPGTVGLVNAAHEMGIPVIVGGRAFGSDDRRAKRLGADAWAADAQGAAEVLADWQEHPPMVTTEPVVLDESALALFAQSSTLASAALDALATSSPAIDGGEEHRAPSHEDMSFVVQFRAAAMLVDDDGLFEDFLVWLHELLRARGISAQALCSGLEELVPQVTAVDVRATRLFEQGLQRLTV